jgi:hypothetical protein
MRNIADRRSSQDFHLRLPIRCGRIDCESLIISSKRLLFATPEAFQPGQRVKAFIDWPIRLDDSTRLKLVVEGPVVRKTGDRVAMRIERYEFRTRGAAEWRSDSPLPVPPEIPEPPPVHILPLTVLEFQKIKHREGMDAASECRQKQ